ncbi:MAG TPA: imidazole glycerol phosphate synthase subunit HisF [Candidatus Thermoplasmatota archaeon]|nr:imidazole glycerol phosphate synthase subunit HisF [Candidatus Thermoplasmatota archaeon]
MLKKRVIPCLDVDRGRVVKGVNFRGLREVGDPVAMAQAYEAQGADEIVFLDISASKEGRRALLPIITRTAENLFIPLTVGGGVSRVEDVDRLLRAGADKVAMNTGAVRDPKLITGASKEFGAQCVVVAIDAQREGKGWRVFTHGGSRPTDLDAVAWARDAAKRGAGEILLTSMDRDGTKDGYDLALTAAVARAAPIPVIASGGAGRVEHLRDALTKGKASAALAASIFHFGELTVGDVKSFLDKAGVAVRP